jgi:hypothetical protein
MPSEEPQSALHQGLRAGGGSDHVPAHEGEVAPREYDQEERVRHVRSQHLLRKIGEILVGLQPSRDAHPILKAKQEVPHDQARDHVELHEEPEPDEQCRELQFHPVPRGAPHWIIEVRL